LIRNAISTIVLATTVAAPLHLASAQETTGSVEFQLLEAPSDRQNDPRARIYIIDHVHPGDSISRKIGVTNRSDARIRVQLYAGAAELTDGEFVPGPGSGGNDLATWTSLDAEAIDVPAFDNAVATVTIAVPRDASAGERYGAVWAQLPRSTPTRGGPSEVNRVGIRMYVSVGPGGEPRTDFAIDSLTAQRTKEGRPTVVVEVRNTGGRALDMTGSLRLTKGPGGLSAGPYRADLGTTLGLGKTDSVTVPLDEKIPDGPWSARITLRSGSVERSATATIRFPHAQGAADPVKVRPETSGWLTQALAVIGALAVLLLVLLVLRRRRRSRAPDAGEPRPAPALLPSSSR
jgi:MYXO-CTERM domain-containing protein